MPHATYIFNGASDFPARFVQRLAAFHRDSAAQIVIVLFEQCRKFEKILDAFDGGRASPRGKRRRRGLRGLIEFGGRGQGDLRHALPGRRIADIQVFRRRGRPPLTADEILYLFAARHRDLP